MMADISELRPTCNNQAFFQSPSLTLTMLTAPDQPRPRYPARSRFCSAFTMRCCNSSSMAARPAPFRSETFTVPGAKAARRIPKDSATR
jgi:hypothetical protein